MSNNNYNICEFVLKEIETFQPIFSNKPFNSELNELEHLISSISSSKQKTINENAIKSTNSERPDALDDMKVETSDSIGALKTALLNTAEAQNNDFKGMIYQIS
jgi:hypothetical protein